MKSGLSTLSEAIVGSARQARIACEIPSPAFLSKVCLASEARQAEGGTPVVKGGGRRVMWSTRRVVHMSRPTPSLSIRQHRQGGGTGRYSCRRGAGGRISKTVIGVASENGKNRTLSCVELV